MAAIVKHFGMLLMVLFLLSTLFLAGCGDDDDDDSGGGSPATDDDDDDTDDDDTDDDDTDDDDATCAGCLIDTVCYPDGAINPENVCEICDEATANDGWSANDGATCDDELFCNGADTCSAGVCDQHAGDPCDAPCQTCDDAADACEDAAGACDDGIFCNGEDTCLSGACDDHAGDPCALDEVCSEPDVCTVSCFEDADMDGHGDGGTSQERDVDCPFGWVANKTDCDALIYLTNPDAFDLPDDGIDQDCDGFDFLASDAVGIFVDGATGTPSPCSGTMANPCDTIMAGIDVAEQTGKNNVFVAQGTYVESVIISYVSLFGGYDSSNWSRDIETNETIIDSTSPQTVYVDNSVNLPAGLVVVNGFTINGRNTGTDSLGVSVNYASVQLIGNEIDGGGSSWHTRGLFFNYANGLVAYNTINGGSAGTSEHSWGADISYSIATLVGNTIKGGNDQRFAIGVETYDSHLTLIDNEIDGGTCISACSNKHGVLFYSGYGLFFDNKITGGDSGNNGDNFGVYVAYADARLIDNEIDGGTADVKSHGLYLKYADVYARGNTITGNLSVKNGKTASNSYGIHSFYSDSTLIGNTIDGGGNANNTTGAYFRYNDHTLVGNKIDGGSGNNNSFGLDLNNTASAVIVNNLISGGAGYNAKGLQVYYGTSTIIHNTIDGGGTASADSSYGVYFYYDTNIDLINNIIGGGDSTTYSSAILANMNPIYSPVVNIYGNDLWNTVDCLVNYNDLGWNCLTILADVNALGWAGDNVSADPSFDVDGFHLTSGSTAVIDMGVAISPWYAGSLTDTDYDGEDRPNGSDPDIGADEYYAPKK
jgi:hypothetical protein